jgi:hypothetical protein
VSKNQTTEKTPADINLPPSPQEEAKSTENINSEPIVKHQISFSEFTTELYHRILTYSIDACSPELFKLENFCQQMGKTIKQIQQVRNLISSPDKEPLHIISKTSELNFNSHSSADMGTANYYEYNSKTPKKSGITVQKSPISIKIPTQPIQEAISIKTQSENSALRNQIDEKTPKEMLLKNLRQSPFEQTPVIKKLFVSVGNDLTHLYKHMVELVGIIDYISLSNYGKYSSCSESDSKKCTKCKKKCGVRGNLQIFLLDEQPLQLSIWTQDLINALGISKLQLIRSSDQQPEEVKRAFLYLYTGRLAYMNATFKAYGGGTSISCTQFCTISFTHLYNHLGEAPN